MHANIIGAGIAGPMAALTLRSNGFAVDVWETRAEQDLYSHGILGITDESWRILRDHGVSATDRALSFSGHDGLDGLVWTDLHQTVTERATRIGATFHYGQPFSGKPTDLTVWSTGVGSAKEVTTPHYTGYTIIRGLAYQRSGASWSELEGGGYTKKPWYFMAGDIPTGTSIALFVPRENPTLHTTYSVDAPPETETLPLRWKRLTESVPQWQIVPMSDWDVPGQMIHEQPQATPIVRIGDANGQLRPMTAMGANLALSEASDVDLLVRRSHEAEDRLLTTRRIQHDIGLMYGIHS